MTKKWFLRKRSVFVLTAVFTILFSVVAFAADPVDNFIGNLANAVKGWGTKGGVIWVIYGIFNVARGVKEEDPHMKSKGWKNATAAIIFTAGCSQADNIVNLIRSWAS